MTIKLPRIFSNNANWLEKQQTTILSGAAIIGIANLISAFSKLFVQRMLISSFFDTALSQESLEAFWFAFQIPDMMYQLIIIGALSAAFIPIFTSQKKKDIQVAFTMSSIMMNTLLLAFVFVSIFIFIFADPITRFRTGDQFSPYQIEIIINLTRIMLVSQFFFAISNFLTGILQSFQRFILPAIAPIVYNLGIILGVYFFSGSMGIYSAGIGVVIGSFIHMIVQLPLVLKLGFRYKLSFNLKYPGIKEFFKLMPPRTFSIGASEARKLLLGYFASSIPGKLSFLMMQLAFSLMVFPIRFFGVPISQASLPFLSEESTDQDLDKFKGLVLQSLHQIAFLTFPSAILLLILRVPIVRLAYGTFNFPWDATIMTGKLVAIVAISIPAQALVHLLIRAFYALKDTKTPLIISFWDVLLYGLISYYFVTFTTYGALGIALATTITALIEFLMYLYLLDRKVKGFAQKEFWVPQIKMIMASFFMAVFLYLPYRTFDQNFFFDTSRTIDLIALTIITSTIGMLVYIYFASLFKIHELKMVTNLLSSFGPWQKPLQKAKEVLLDSGVDTENT